MTLSEPAADPAPYVIVCDDHIAIRTGVTQILEKQGITVAGQCHTVPALMELISQFPAAVIMTDLAVDALPFPELVKKARQQSPDCKIVVYSMREGPGTIGLCYEAGAAAFVPKRSEPEEIINAVLAADRGERYFPPDVASHLASLHVDGNAPKNILNARELEIFTGYASGETAEVLAAKLNVSEKTINNALSQISKKLDAPRATFYQIARRYGLVDDVAI